MCCFLVTEENFSEKLYFRHVLPLIEDYKLVDFGDFKFYLIHLSAYVCLHMYKKISFIFIY